jgi:hypothetical protein
MQPDDLLSPLLQLLQCLSWRTFFFHQMSINFDEESLNFLGEINKVQFCAHSACESGVGLTVGMVALPLTTLHAATDTADGHAARQLKATLLLAGFLVR